MGSEARLWFLSPGPLTHPHQNILTSLSKDSQAIPNNCSACHAAAHQGPAGWLKTAFFKTGFTDEQRCLDCHDKGSHPFIAHNVSPEQLRYWSPENERDTNKKIACAACHKEYHGADFDLKAITDQQCQICHAKPFESFSKNHPPFPTTMNGHPISFPFKQRAKITFDHVTHFETHFKKTYLLSEDVPDQCIDCHGLNPLSGRMSTKPFEQSCAACHHHTQQIEGTPETEPINFIQLPGIDTKSAEKGGVDLSFWKAGRRAGSKELTPILQLLIKGANVYPDPDYIQTNRPSYSLSKDLNLLSPLRKVFKDLRKANRAQLEAVQRIAYAVRYLFREVSAFEGL
ncbi:MAG: hypothetical protein GKR87_12530 [Kiritimatiellae bacterium]|nr:hypothetical protein [Kiritimatiellia bacterium]